MIALLTLYEAVRVPLVEDRIEVARAAAREIDAGDGASEAVVAAATRVAQAPDAAATRTAFGELSRGLVLQLAGGDTGAVKVFRCPMVEGYAYWLQASSGIANPYMGTSMPACGEGASFKAAHKAALDPTGTKR